LFTSTCSDPDHRRASASMEARRPRPPVRRDLGFPVRSRTSSAPAWPCLAAAGQHHFRDGRLASWRAMAWPMAPVAPVTRNTRAGSARRHGGLAIMAARSPRPALQCAPADQASFAGSWKTRFPPRSSKGPDASAHGPNHQMGTGEASSLVRRSPPHRRWADGYPPGTTAGGDRPEATMAFSAACQDVDNALARTASPPRTTASGDRAVDGLRPPPRHGGNPHDLPGAERLSLDERRQLDKAVPGSRRQPDLRTSQAEIHGLAADRRARGSRRGSQRPAFDLDLHHSGDAGGIPGTRGEADRPTRDLVSPERARPRDVGAAPFGEATVARCKSCRRSGSPWRESARIPAGNPLDPPSVAGRTP